MVLAVLVPVLGLIAFSAYVVHEKLQSYRDSADLLQAAQFARTAHALARELENERSLAALYIGTDRLAWRSELEDQRQQTDERVATFRALMSQAKIRALVGRPNLDLGLGTVDALRAGTDGDDDLRKMLDGYGSVISTLINTSSKLSRADLSNLIAAYMDLGNIKDRIARMRSIGASWLLRGGADRELVALFAEAHAEKKAFLQSFRGHASTEQLQLFDDIVRGPILDEVARLDALALSGRLTKADTRTWDRTHTALVDLIVRAEEKLASEMERHIQANHLLSGGAGRGGAGGVLAGGPAPQRTPRGDLGGRGPQAVPRRRAEPGLGDDHRPRRADRIYQPRLHPHERIRTRRGAGPQSAHPALETDHQRHLRRNVADHRRRCRMAW
jgi:hypothetical protein